MPRGPKPKPRHCPRCTNNLKRTGHGRYFRCSCGGSWVVRDGQIVEARAKGGRPPGLKVKIKKRRTPPGQDMEWWEVELLNDWVPVEVEL